MNLFTHLVTMDAHRKFSRWGKHISLSFIPFHRRLLLYNIIFNFRKLYENSSVSDFYYCSSILDLLITNVGQANRKTADEVLRNVATYRNVEQPHV